MDLGGILDVSSTAEATAQKRWARQILRDAINTTDNLIAISARPMADHSTFPSPNSEFGPDLLVFPADVYSQADESIRSLFDTLQTAPAEKHVESLRQLEQTGILTKAVCGLCLTSSRLCLSHRHHSGSPTVTVTDSAFSALATFQESTAVPLYVCQLFFDCGYLIPFAAYRHHRDCAQQGRCESAGFKYGSTTGDTEGLHAAIESFPPAQFLGRFTTLPAIVDETGERIGSASYRWGQSGRLVVSGESTGVFAGGRFEFEQPLLDLL